MMEWFRSGGFGMVMVLVVGAGAIGYGIKALGKPTADRLAILKSLPGLIVMSAVFAFGTNMWAVNRFLTNEAFQKANNITQGELPLAGIVGFTEATQPFTLAGALAAIAIVLRMLAEAKKARTEG